MAFTVKSIINNAYDRSGIFPNSTSTLPGELCEGALKVLQGIVQSYNIQGILLPTQTRKEFKIEGQTMTFNKELEGFEDDVATISKLYLKNGDDSAFEIEFVPFMEFDSCPNSYTYTYNQTKANEFDVYFKKILVGREGIIHYIRPIECELNTEYYLPFEYEEFFTLSLIVKLLTIYPRENDKQQEGFKEELASIRNSIVTRQGESKLIIFNRHDYNSLWELGNSGRYMGL